MVTDMLERIRAAVRRKGVTAYALAHKAGLHRNTLVGVHSRDWNPTAETLMKLEPHIEAIERGDWVPDQPEQAAA